MVDLFFYGDYLLILLVLLVLACGLYIVGCPVFYLYFIGSPGVSMLTFVNALAFRLGQDSSGL